MRQTWLVAMPHCHCHLHYSPHENRTTVIAGHHQRCPAIHVKLAAMYERMAEKKEKK